MSARYFQHLPTAGKAYVVSVVAAGALILAHSLQSLIEQQTQGGWIILALLTLVSGSATVKLPGLPATVSVSETFVLTSVLLFGAPAGTVTVALDALVISVWSYKRGDPIYKLIFNTFALPLTIWIASQVFFSLPDWKPWLSKMEPMYHNPPIQTIHLLGPLCVLAGVYFSLNSWLIAVAISFERNISPYQIWRKNFALLALNYFGGASVAALLVTYTRNIEWAYVALILPLLVALYFTFWHSMGRVSDTNRHLSELNTLYMSTIETLAMAIDAKDQITHGHIRRVQTYAVGLAQRIGVADPDLIKAIEAAALLHDMGKLAVPEYILNKPGPLTPAEFEKMKLHASVGADILSAINFPYPVVPIVRHHHENWDGTGYPDGLAGPDIPMGARILSVVDCFDALTSDRPYRPKLPDEEAISILLKRKGNMYDPLVVDTFLDVHKQIAPAALPELDVVPLRAIADASLNTSPLLMLPQRPLEEIAASTEEMLTLFHLARGLNSQMTLQDVGDVIVKHLRRLVPCSLAVFFVYKIENDELIAAHAIGEGASLVGGMRIDRGERLSGWVAANRKTIRNSDPILDLGELVRSITPRLTSCLSAPLVSQDSLIGVLSLYSPIRNAFTDEHQRVVEVVSRQVSTIVRQASEFDRTKQISRRDKVTGLPSIENLKQLSGQDPSRDVLDEPTSVVIVELTQRPGSPVAYGDEAMSSALTVVAQAIRKTLRAADLLFRHREGEFIILLLHTPIETTRAIVRRLRETLQLECKGALPQGLSWTIAMTTAPEEGTSIAALIEGATQKLLQEGHSDSFGQSGSDAVH